MNNGMWLTPYMYNEADVLDYWNYRKDSHNNCKQCMSLKW